MPIDLTGVSTFHTTITVPEAGDDRKASSIVPAMQKLLDNTTDLSGRIDEYHEDEHTWLADQIFASSLGFGAGVDGPYYVTPPTRKVLVPLTPFASSNWNSFTGPPEWSTTTSDVFAVDVGRNVIPSGAILVAVRACVNTQLDVTLTVRQVTINTASSAAGTVGTAYDDTFSPTGTQAHILVATFPADTYHNNDVNKLEIMIDPAVGTGTLVLRWIELEYLDQTLRND